MRILGIDPGLAIVGWGVVDYNRSKFHTAAYGALRTPAGIPTERRLELLYGGMQELLATYHPDDMAIEELFFNTNITTGIRVAEARGVLLLFIFFALVPIIQAVVPVQQLTDVFTASRRAPLFDSQIILSILGA